jgi:hypothetical protein
MFSQSYPIQRIEGNDTLVIMTLSQAVTMNDRFLELRGDIDSAKNDLAQMHQVADSLATGWWRSRIELHNSKRQQQFTSRMFFGFWAAFISYLQLTK